MSPSIANVLALVLGAAALGHVIRNEGPGRGRLLWAAVASAGLTVLLLAARRQFPLRSQVGPTTASWWDEIIAGGTPLIELPYAGPTRIAGAIVWLLVFAACLHDSARDDEERGPWVLALLPLALMALILVVGLPGVPGTGGATGVKPASLVALALAASGIAAVFYWHRRRRSR